MTSASSLSCDHVEELRTVQVMSVGTQAGSVEQEFEQDSKMQDQERIRSLCQYVSMLILWMNSNIASKRAPITQLDEKDRI